MTPRSFVIVVGTVVVVLCVVFYLVGPARYGSAQTWTIKHGWCYGQMRGEVPALPRAWCTTTVGAPEASMRG